MISFLAFSLETNGLAKYLILQEIKVADFWRVFFRSYAIGAQSPIPGYPFEE